jgi:hypothetical protein
MELKSIFAVLEWVGVPDDERPDHEDGRKEHRQLQRKCIEDGAEQHDADDDTDESPRSRFFFVSMLKLVKKRARIIRIKRPAALRATRLGEVLKGVMTGFAAHNDMIWS